MKTWHLTYSLVWVAFFDILLGLFSPSGNPLIIPVHAVVGLLIVGLAFDIQRRVGRSECPPRIKRITRTTWYLALLQLILGALLAGASSISLGGIAMTLIILIHAANALAIVTQASSSATAFDMWEEKEFAPITPASPS
ncbi:MAG: hypothetical protein JRN24_01465 [Nitrososphaerota archaeon]|nr:hypothetical protein [Nitrososphaerota archaeon]